MIRIAIAVMVFLSAGPALAQQADDGRVVLARGDATVRTATASTPASAGMIVRQGDQVRTGRDGAVRLLLAGSAVVDLSANTSMVITRSANTSGSSQTRVKVWSGRLWARVQKLFGSESNFEVESPNAVAGVRGTEFVVDVAPNGATEITVLDGAVSVAARDGGPQRLLEIGGRITARDSKELSVGTASPSDRRSLRASSSAGGRLDSSRAPSRFSGVSGHLPAGGGLRRAAPGGFTPRPENPPIDIDPASGRTRIRGTLELRE